MQGGGRGASWWGLLVLFVVVVGAHGNKIYFPGDVEKIREAIGLKKCLKDPTCVPPPHLLAGNRCKAGGGTDIDELLRVTTRGGGGGGPACNSRAGEVVWPATGKCVALLTQGPCPPGQWVQLLKDTYEPVCRPQPCDLPASRGGVMVGDKCYSPSQLPPTSSCPSNQQFITNEHGELECDCQPGFVYYQGDKTCYEPYTQGPCAPGWVIRVEDVEGGRGTTTCFQNPCPNERMVEMDASCHVVRDTGTGTRSSTGPAPCYPLDSQGPCQDSRITIDRVLAEPLCLTTHSIFQPVVSSCPRGTRRDHMGRCRKSFDSILANIPLFVTRRPGLRGTLCPPGEFFAGGTCIKVAG